MSSVVAQWPVRMMAAPAIASNASGRVVAPYLAGRFLVRAASQAR